VFTATPDIIDVDTSVEAPQAKLIVHIDRQKAALLGIGQQQVVSALATAMVGTM
jgi:multidrug efflux pump subunit AcrB